jgi:hypothetical protein
VKHHRALGNQDGSEADSIRAEIVVDRPEMPIS